MAVDSIVRTLAANLSTVYRLKILIRGQDADTLAGHLDLSQFFTIPAQAPPQTPAAAVPSPDQPLAALPARSNSPGQQPSAVNSAAN
jgi:hypothetical protein